MNSGIRGCGKGEAAEKAILRRLPYQWTRGVAVVAGIYVMLRFARILINDEEPLL